MRKILCKFSLPLGDFSGIIDHLPIIPMEEMPSFVKESDIISPSWLYRNFNYSDT